VASDDRLDKCGAQGRDGDKAVSAVAEGDRGPAGEVCGGVSFFVLERPKALLSLRSSASCGLSVMIFVGRW
jgi:hypothetical protein